MEFSTWSHLVKVENNITHQLSEAIPITEINYILTTDTTLIDITGNSRHSCNLLTSYHCKYETFFPNKYFKK